MFRARRDDDRQGGQILVLFALVLVVILAFAAIAIDLGVLRNNRQTLVNAIDSAAIAGGTKMPVDGAVAGEAAQVNNLVVASIQANYPGLPGSAYTITYRCLVGIDGNTPPKPWISRDIPVVCDPSHALGWTGFTTLAQKEAAFQGAGPTRFSLCDPSLGDRCNVVVVTGTATTNYSFGRVVGVNSGSTGAVMSAACNGPCGQPPAAPVDLVVLIDRTNSMSSTQVSNARNAARTVLGVYDPTLQRVAVGFLGPGETTTTCSGGGGGPAVHANAFQGVSAVAPSIAGSTTANVQSQANGNPPSPAAPAAGVLTISKPTATANGSLLVAGITVDGGTNTAVTAPTGAGGGWTLELRTNNSTNISLLTYYKYITNAGAEPASYSWTISPNARAAGGILRYTGVNPADPINISGGGTGNDTGSPFRVTAPAVTTTTDQAALIGFYAMDNGGTFGTYSNPPNPTERFDRRNANGGGPSLAAATSTDTAPGSSGTSYGTASVGGQYVAQHVALNPLPYDTYGAAYPADLGKWIPVGFTGTDTDTPAPTYNEAYSDGDGNVFNTSHAASAINCFDFPGGTGTNLTTPVYMAAQYLQQYGRPNVKWGILFETDGEPNYGGFGSQSGEYTCQSAVTNATNAKAITNADGRHIELFTVGFFDTGADPNCPDTSGPYQGDNVSLALSHMASTNLSPSPNGSANGCIIAENTDQDHFFCQPKTEDLATVFSQIATTFAGIRSHLVQLYPPPIVTAVNPALGTHLGGTVVTISGKHFTGATSVKYGSTAAATFTVNSDTQITATAPAGTNGTTVNIIVTTPGGTSPIVVADRFTYN